MEYEFDIFYRAGIKHQAADTLSRLNTEGTDGSHIEDDIPVMAVAIRTQSRQNKFVDTTLDKTLNEKTEPNLPTLDEFLSA